MNLKEFIKKTIEEILEEESLSGDIGAYSTPFAFKKDTNKDVQSKLYEEMKKLQEIIDRELINIKESSLIGLKRHHRDKISKLSFEQKKALYDDLNDAIGKVNDMDFDGPNAKANYAKAMKNAKIKVYQKHNILESLNILIKNELINEVTYSQFKREAKFRTKSEQLHKAIKEVKKKIQEIDRIVEYTSRMKQELSEDGGVSYWKATEKYVGQISEMVNHLNNKLKNLSQ